MKRITDILTISAAFLLLLSGQPAIGYPAPSEESSSETLSRQYAPVVFMHGFLGSGDTWAPQVQRFVSNGVPADRLFAYDWNTLAIVGDGNALLDRFVDSVLQVTGAAAIHLVGHSAGGGRGYAYLSDTNRAAKVISYVHIGSGANRSPAGPDGSVPTLNIYSDGDRVVRGGDISGALNVKLHALDHYEVATSVETFAHMFRFFYSEEPKTTEIVAGKTIKIAGKVLALGTNIPSEGVRVAMYEADPSGNPAGNALESFTVTTSGNWGPFDVEPEKHYMFHLTVPRQDSRNLYYYFEPFQASNPLVYLRTFPPPVSMAGLLLAGLPADDEKSVVAIFSSSQAVIAGRDKLTLNDYLLSTPDLAGEKATSISFFCYDSGNDGRGNAEPMGFFSAMPFLQGADIPIFTAEAETLQITFNGRTIPVRNFKSASEGIVIALFW